MFEKWSTWQLVSLACALYLLFLGITNAMPDAPITHDASFAAVATTDINTRTSGGTGVQTPPLSYCAHWFARDGSACITTGTAGQLVVVDTGIPHGSSSEINAAASNCQRTGCKVALYCECESAAQVQQLKAIFADYAVRFPGVMFPAVEVDGIRDIPGKNIEVAQALGGNGFRLILKNYNAIERFSPYTPVARIIYEDIGRTGSYLAEFKALAQSHPTLLISGILHQGSYASSGGTRAYPGTSAQEAQQIFTELSQFKNVELFYGTPTGFQKLKSFDGSMQGIAREEGVITSRYTPPGVSTTAGVPTTGGVPTAGLVQGVQSLMNPQAQAQQPAIPYTPANIQLDGFSPYATGTAQFSTNTNSQNATSAASTIITYANGVPIAAAPASSTPIALNQDVTVSQTLSARASTDTEQQIADIAQLPAPSSFGNAPDMRDTLIPKSVLDALVASVLDLLKSVSLFLMGRR